MDHFDDQNDPLQYQTLFWRADLYLSNLDVSESDK